MGNNTNISGYLVAILLFTFIIVGGVSMLSIMRNEDATFGGDKYSEFNSSFNKLTEINDLVGDYERNINQTEEGETGITDWLDTLIKRSSRSLKLVGSSYDFMDDAYRGTTKMFGIPAWVITILTLIISVILIFAFISAVFQRRI